MAKKSFRAQVDLRSEVALQETFRSSMGTCQKPLNRKLLRRLALVEAFLDFFLNYYFNPLLFMFANLSI